MWKEEARFYGRLVLVTVLIIAVIFAWHHFAPKPETTQQISQQQAQTTEGQKEAAHKSGSNISDNQAANVAAQISSIYERNLAALREQLAKEQAAAPAPGKEPPPGPPAKKGEPPTPAVTPTETIKATGGTAQMALDKSKIKNHADYQEVTDPRNPNQKPDLAAVGKDEPLWFYVYNVQAYPAELWSASMGTRTVGLSHSNKVKVFGATGYWGVGARYDRRDGDFEIETMVTIPRN